MASVNQLSAHQCSYEEREQFPNKLCQLTELSLQAFQFETRTTSQLVTILTFWVDCVGALGQRST